LIESIEKELKNLYYKWSGSSVESIDPLVKSGSDRQYYRLTTGSRSVIGAFSADKRETRAFKILTNHFRSLGLHVPEFYADNIENDIYLLEDLGDRTLYADVINRPNTGNLPEFLKSNYQNAIRHLIRFQTEGCKDLDFSICYPRENFDQQSIQWDLNYFKYYCLKFAGILFDEQALEDDFSVLTEYLLTADSKYFMFRDFQSRNIMIKGGDLFFIDYQGGRRGPLQYDLVSLLFQAKAMIPEETRNELLQYYLKELKKNISVSREQFVKQYNAFVLIRLLQVLGAYGYRGFYEKKPHFMKSFDHALANLEVWFQNYPVPIKLPELTLALQKLLASSQKSNVRPKADLEVKVTSFSYKKGIPADDSGNGGGFVFDCRALPNPGRQEKYKSLTGMDKAVINYLENEPAVEKFIYNVIQVIEPAIENYIKREFSNLMVSFGCTGGQHRSVYCSERINSYLNTRYNINLILQHQERNNWITKQSL